MNADRIGFDHHLAAILRTHSTACHHVLNLGERGLHVFDHRAHEIARRQRAIGLIAAIGEYLVTFAALHEALERLRITVQLTPASSVALPFAPRDLYPLDANDDPLGASGNVEASQRGFNTGVVYFRVDEPAFGTLLEHGPNAVREAAAEG